ncbi:hypothetical protein GCM10027280_37990 [Micromonospora polyrhachis]
MRLLATISDRVMRLVSPSITADAASTLACRYLGTTCDPCGTLWLDQVVEHYNCEGQHRTIEKGCSTCAG